MSLIGNSETKHKGESGGIKLPPRLHPGDANPGTVGGFRRHRRGPGASLSLRSHGRPSTQSSPSQDGLFAQGWRKPVFLTLGGEASSPPLSLKEMKRQAGGEMQEEKAAVAAGQAG